MDLEKTIEEKIKKAGSYQQVVNQLVNLAIDCDSEISLFVLKKKAGIHFGKQKVPEKLTRAIQNSLNKCTPLAIEAANTKTLKENTEIERLAKLYNLKNDEVSEALMIAKVEIFARYVEGIEHNDARNQWEEFHCVLWYECSADVMLHQGMADVIKKSREIGSDLCSMLTDEIEDIAEGAYKKRYSLQAAISKLRKAQSRKQKNDN